MKRSFLVLTYRATIIVLTAPACGSLWGFDELSNESSDANDAHVADGGDVEDGTDGAAASTEVDGCSPETKFDPPTAIVALNSGADDMVPRLTDDELRIFFTTTRNGKYELFEAERTAIAEPFAAPRLLSDVASYGDPMITGDGLRLYFTSSSDGGALDLSVATRASLTVSFAAAVSLGSSVNSPAFGDFQPFAAAAGLAFVSDRGGRREIWFASGQGGAFAPAVLAYGTNVDGDDGWPVMSSDGLVLYFAASRQDASGGQRIWMTRRKSTSETFAAPTAVQELDSQKGEIPGWLSQDLCRLYLSSMRNGTFDLFVATRRRN